MRDLSVSLFEMHVSDLFKSDKFHKTRKVHQKLHGLLDFVRTFHYMDHNLE